MKDLVHQFQHKKETFDLQKRHNNYLDLAKKHSYFSNYTIDIFLFVTAIILVVVTSIFLYIIHKHAKLKALGLTTVKRSGCSNQAGTCLSNA